MKILIVCQHFYPEEFRINDICYELSKKGHNVTVLTGLPNYPKGKVLKEYKWFRKRKEQINNVKIVRSFLIGRGKSTFCMGINYLSFILFGTIKALFLKKDFDIIYVYQLSPITMAWPAILVKKIIKKPLIIHCLDQWPISVTTGPINKKSKLYKILYHISKWTYEKSDLITISSESFKHYFEKELNIKEKEFIYMPSYAEECFDKIEYINNDSFDLVFAGNIGPAQSVETIIECANLLKDYKKIQFHIIGDGLNKKKCEKISEGYKLENIKFYGFYPVEKINKFYDLADAFLITMVNNEVVNQTLPAKIQSYMFAGKPIIGAISGEVKKVVEDANCGICCNSLDYNGLADNILKIYKNKDQLKKWGKNGKEYYKKYYTKEKFINNLEEIFQKLIIKNKN